MHERVFFWRIPSVPHFCPAAACKSSLRMPSMNVALLALLGLASVTRGVLMPAIRCPPHLGRRFACTMCEEPPAAKLLPPPLESEALQRGVEVPPGATRVSEAEAARHPAEPDRAIAIVSELRSNAALFAAFAFGALSLIRTRS